jgi:MerC mercury resistance protein
MQKTDSYLAKLGAGLSLACAVHCATLPLLVTFLPLFGISFLESHEFELGFLGLSVVLALYVLGRDYQNLHKKNTAILLAISGFSVIILGHYLPEFESFLAVIGGLVLFGAYLVNWRLNRQVKVCKC